MCLYIAYNLSSLVSSTVEREASEKSPPSTENDIPNANQPKNFKFPKRRFGSQNRSFQPSWFDDYNWLHYDEKKDSVLCFICSKEYVKGNLKTAVKKEMTFITQGFSNWKKATQRIKKSECHKTAIDFGETKYGNVIEMTNKETKTILQSNRKCLLKIIQTLQFLCRQGIAVQGDTDISSNFVQLLLLS